MQSPVLQLLELHDLGLHEVQDNSADDDHGPEEQP